MTISMANANTATVKVRALPWIVSFFVVLSLMLAMVFLGTIGTDAPEETLTVRNIELSLPPPPPPPPPIKTQPTESDSLTPSINLIGQSSGPALKYSDNPKLTLLNLEKVEKPLFDTSSLDLRKALTIDFPLFEVNELDKIPRLVSTNRISFPRELSRRGILKVDTKVEIIIDQNGQAFVKKIIDPVYPEMIEVIRKAINDSRFTIPTKDGRPVQAVYLYTLSFINRA
jgi:hypothetical protein